MLVLTGLDFGGAETQVIHLAKGFKAGGHGVKMVSLLPLVGQAQEVQQAGIDLVSLNMRRGFPDPRAAWQLASMIREWKPDVVHAHMIHANFISRMSRLLAPAPVYISTAHNVYEQMVSEGGQLPRTGGWRDLGYRYTDWLCDLTTNVSQAGVDRYVKEGLAAASRIIFMPNGIDLERFSGDPAQGARLRQELDPEAEFIWLAVGRLEPQKDYPNMLEAFKRVLAQRPTAKLWIVGQGFLQAEIEAYATRVELHSSVRVLGLRRDVGNLMCAADGFVMSSAWEGLPMVLLEASILGLPIVATDVGGNRDVVQPNSGLLVPSRNAQALAEGMLEMMNFSADQRRGMGAAGKEYVQKTFALNTVLERWEDLYAGLIAKRKKT
jgi:glycosyltransferase involved in cell wall biosynthesis